MSRSASDRGMDGSGGTTGAPRPRQLPTTAAVVAVALSVTSTSATVLTVVFGGCLWEAARAHFVQHDIPKCQRLQKVHPFTVGSGVYLRASGVFSPDNRRRRGIGRGLAMGSPSLPVPRPGRLGGSVPGGVPVESGWGNVVGGMFAGRSKD